MKPGKGTPMNETQAKQAPVRKHSNASKGRHVRKEGGPLPPAMRLRSVGALRSWHSRARRFGLPRRLGGAEFGRAFVFGFAVLDRDWGRALLDVEGSCMNGHVPCRATVMDRSLRCK